MKTVLKTVLSSMIVLASVQAYAGGTACPGGAFCGGEPIDAEVTIIKETVVEDREEVLNSFEVQFIPQHVQLGLVRVGAVGPVALPLNRAEWLGTLQKWADDLNREIESARSLPASQTVDAVDFRGMLVGRRAGAEGQVLFSRKDMFLHFQTNEDPEQFAEQIRSELFFRLVTGVHRAEELRLRSLRKRMLIGIGLRTSRPKLQCIQTTVQKKQFVGWSEGSERFFLAHPDLKRVLTADIVSPSVTLPFSDCAEIL